MAAVPAVAAAVVDDLDEEREGEGFEEGDFDCEEEAPAASATASSVGAGSTASGPKGGKRAKVKAQAARAKRPAKNENAICKVLKCNLKCKRDKSRCEGHNRTYDAMYYQAKQDGELEILHQVIGDPEKELQAMTDFVKETPPDKLFMRKGKSNRRIVWATFKTVYGIRKSVADVEEDVPMTNDEFTRWAEEDKRMTTVGAAAWWMELKRTPHVHRDKKGRCALGKLGEMRLWIPNAVEKRARMFERYVDAQALREDFRIKGARDEEMDALKNMWTMLRPPPMTTSSRAPM